MDKLLILTKLGRAADSLHHAINLIDYQAARVRTAGPDAHCPVGVQRAVAFALMGLQYVLQSLDTPDLVEARRDVTNAGELLTFQRQPK